MNKIDYNEWKHDAKCILTNIMEALERDDIDEIKKYLFYSPAGDEMGDDNYTIRYKKFDEKYDKGDIFEPIYGGFKINRNLPKHLLKGDKE